MVKFPLKTFQIQTSQSADVTIFLAPPGFASVASHLHGVLFEEHWSEESFYKLLRDESIIALGVEIACEKTLRPRTIGFILLRCAVGEADIVTLGVDQACQGWGIGQKLCECAFEWIYKEREIRSVFLEVDEENQSALRLYEKLRFEVVGRRKAYYTVRVKDSEGSYRKRDALILRRDIGEIK